MPDTLPHDPVLRRLRDELDRAFGDRIERVVLFGSRARGDARADSDYDVAVFLHDFESAWRESGRIAPIISGVAADFGELIETVAFPAFAYRKDTTFMRQLRRDGRDL